VSASSSSSDLLNDELNPSELENENIDSLLEELEDIELPEQADTQSSLEHEELNNSELLFSINIQRLLIVRG